MSDKFSVDDILKELDSKKGGKGSPEPETPSVSGDTDSLTAELAKIEKQRFGKPIPKNKPINSPKKYDLSVTQILNTTPSKTPPKSDAPKKPISRSGASREDDKSEGTVKPVKIQRFKPPEKTEQPTGESISPAYGKFKPTKKDLGGTQTTELKPKPAQAVKGGEESEKPFRPVKKDLSVTQILNEASRLPEPERFSETKDVADNAPVEFEMQNPLRRSEKRNAARGGSSVAVLDKPVAEKAPVPKPNLLLPEEKERLQKLREQELLQKDLALEEPHDLIDGLNPYDVKNIDSADVVNIKVTRDMGLGGGESKDGDGGDGEDKNVGVNPETEVKEYTPAKVKAKKENRLKRGNSALLESLNLALLKKRQSDIDARRTLSVDTLSSVSGRGDYKGRTLPAKLNIDYKKQIIEDSAVLPNHDPFFLQMEERELGKKKKRKIRDFILDDIDDGYDGDEQQDEEEDNGGEFDGYGAGTQIWEDLNESHKGLKWRFALLFLMTAALAFITFVYDAGSSNKLNKFILENIFENESNTMANTFIYMNLIAGIIGISVCSGVILRGLQGLFTGKADCDSICAVPCVLSVVTAAIYLSSPDLLSSKGAYVYVSVAMLALLFNTIGKLMMIVRAKRNFRFISGDSAKYFAHIVEDGESADTFTKGMLSEIPVPVFLRKTEFLTDYLKNSYCTDLADLICRKLTPLAVALAVVAGATVYFTPISGDGIYWAVTVGMAVISVLSPFSIMFLVNNPLLRASKSLSKSDSVVMGYKAAQRFSKVNTAVVDAGMLFPAGSVKFLNVKRCQKPGTPNTITIDESIVIAASLAIKANSVMSNMFYDMISGDSELLYKIENCIYEENMGITGWMGSRRAMLGNRDQMKHHGVDVPNRQKERKHCPPNGEVVYLAVGGETVAMFFIEASPNPAVKNALNELVYNGIALSVMTKDSLVTKEKLADIFDINPEKVKVLPPDSHPRFESYSRYTSRGSSEIACNGTFTSFTKALVCAKTLIRDMTVTWAAILAGMILAGILGIIFIAFATSGMITPTAIIAYNTIWLAVALALQGLRQY